jgi:cobalt/nickel transport system permease protein
MIGAASTETTVGARRRVRRSLPLRTADRVRGAMLEILENDSVATLPGLMQRLDPRFKLGTIVFFAVLATFLHALSSLVLLLLLTMVLARVSRVSVTSFAAKVWASAGLFAVLLALPAATSWITEGRVLLAIGPVAITVPGLLIATRMVVRVVAGASLGLLVIWTTRWADLLRALTRMRVPDLVVATLAMTQKQVLALLRTVENIQLARESRMLGLGTTRQNRGWVVDRIAFVAKKSMRTADEVYDAMLSRGFSGTMPALVPLRAGRRDWLWLALSSSAGAALLALDRLGGLP